MMRTFRLVHVGVAAAMAAAGVVSVGLVQSVTAAGSGTVSSFVPIVPCRLADTRAAADSNVGTRNTPLAGDETYPLQVTGTNGNCTIPSGATGIASNVTAVNPTVAGYVTLWPSDAVRPKASNLNVVAGGPATPNQVTVALSATGGVSVYNLAGTVDIIIDIVGYYTPATATAVSCPTGGCTVFFTGTDVEQSVPAAGYGIEPGTGCFHINPATSANTAVLGFDLPNGAVISAVTVLYRNQNSAANARPTLTLNKNTGPAGGVEAVSFPIPTQYNQSEAGLSLQPGASTPVSTSAQYFLTAGGITNTAATSQSLCGAKVTYTTP